MTRVVLGSQTSRRYDFGLSTDQEARAERLHRDSIVIDLLSQHAGSNIFAHYPPALQSELHAVLAAGRPGFEGYLDAMYWPYEMSRLGKSDLLEEWYQASGLTCGTYCIGVHDGRDPVCLKWEAMAARYAQLPWMRYITTAAEIRQAKREGLVAFYAHWQPVVPAPRDMKALDAAYAKGLRSFMLTYNLMDHIGVGCAERVDAGLSLFVGRCC